MTNNETYFESELRKIEKDMERARRKIWEAILDLHLLDHPVVYEQGIKQEIRRFK